MYYDLKKHVFIVIGAEHYNPLGIVRSLACVGIHPIAVLIRSKERIVSASKFCKKIYYVNNIEEGFDLIVRKYGDFAKKSYKPFLLASDDATTSFYDKRYSDISDKFIFYNAGAAGRISHFMDKEKLCQLAEKYGIKIPLTYKVKKGIIPEHLDYPVLTKADNSFYKNWKATTHICHNKEQLEKAFTEIKQDNVIIQQYINKKNELCLDGYSWNKGKNIFIGIASSYKYILPDCYSYYMDVFNFHNETIYKALTNMFSEIGFEGIFSVEFLVTENDELLFLEINFRNSTWSYAATKAGMNLVVGWSIAMLEGDRHIPLYKEIQKKFTAIVELPDFKIRVLGRKVNIFQWIKDVRKSNCTFYYDKNDRKPFFSAIISKL